MTQTTHRQPDPGPESTLVGPAAARPGAPALVPPEGIERPRPAIEDLPASCAGDGSSIELGAAGGDEAPDRDTPDWERLDPRGWYPLFGRRALTVVLLIVALPVAALLSLPIALVNWMIFRDVRRILYHQPRVGYHGRVFSIVKFRTMRETSKGAFDSWKEGHDGLRITPFGRFLRNTHLDELPQLLNILRGEMDFIGPRPEMIEIHLWACEHVPRFRDRHALLPGITGYAQITQGYAGMDERAYEKKLAADLYYMERLSLRLDLEILARTVIWMLRGRGWRWKPQVRSSDPVSGAPAA